MEARYALRKRPWLDACQMDPESFAPVMPRRHTCMQPFGRICQGPAAAQYAQPSVWGLRSNVERQNIAAIADRLGHSRLPLHSCIGWDAWAAAPWREEVRSHVQTPLGHSDGCWGAILLGFPRPAGSRWAWHDTGGAVWAKAIPATEPSPWAMSPATGPPCRPPAVAAQSMDQGDGAPGQSGRAQNVPGLAHASPVGPGEAGAKRCRAAASMDGGGRREGTTGLVAFVPPGGCG